LKSRGGNVCILSVDFINQIVGWRRSLVPQTKGSHTPIWYGLAVTLKINYYFYYYLKTELSTCPTYITVRRYFDENDNHDCDYGQPKSVIESHEVHGIKLWEC
jgi:hypothetical protein